MESKDFNQFEKELIKAVSESSTSMVKCVFKNYLKILVNCHDEVGRTPLQIAASLGNPEICKLLIDSGAEINAENKTCPSPLMLAASNNHYDTVHLLLEHGADVSRSDADYSAADEAASKGYKNIEILIKSYLIKNALECLFKHPEFDEEMEFSLFLKDELYNLLMIHNDHPIRLLLRLKEKCSILQNIGKFIRALLLMSEQQYRVENNERLSWKCHCIAYIFSLTLEYLNSPEHNPESSNTSENSILDSLIKSWLIHQPRNFHSPTLLNIMQEEISAYPFKDSKIYNAMTMVPVKSFFNEYTLFDTCETCRDRKRLKRCSRCKSVLYCSKTCQKLHWFVHKNECRKLCLSIPSKFKPSQVQG